MAHFPVNRQDVGLKVFPHTELIKRGDPVYYHYQPAEPMFGDKFTTEQDTSTGVSPKVQVRRHDFSPSQGTRNVHTSSVSPLSSHVSTDHSSFRTTETHIHQESVHRPQQLTTAVAEYVQHHKQLEKLSDFNLDVTPSPDSSLLHHQEINELIGEAEQREHDGTGASVEHSFESANNEPTHHEGHVHHDEHSMQHHIQHHIEKIYNDENEVQHVKHEYDNVPDAHVEPRLEQDGDDYEIVRETHHEQRRDSEVMPQRDEMEHFMIQEQRGDEIPAQDVKHQVEEYEHKHPGHEHHDEHSIQHHIEHHIEKYGVEPVLSEHAEPQVHQHEGSGHVHNDEHSMEHHIQHHIEKYGTTDDQHQHHDQHTIEHHIEHHQAKHGHDQHQHHDQHTMEHHIDHHQAKNGDDQHKHQDQHSTEHHIEHHKVKYADEAPKLEFQEPTGQIIVPGEKLVQYQDEHMVGEHHPELNTVKRMVESHERKHQDDHSTKHHTEHHKAKQQQQQRTSTEYRSTAEEPTLQLIHERHEVRLNIEVKQQQRAAHTETSYVETSHIEPYRQHQEHHVENVHYQPQSNTVYMELKQSDTSPISPVSPSRRIESQYPDVDPPTKVKTDAIIAQLKSVGVDGGTVKTLKDLKEEKKLAQIRKEEEVKQEIERIKREYTVDKFMNAAPTHGGKSGFELPEWKRKQIAEKKAQEAVKAEEARLWKEFEDWKQSQSPGWVKELKKKTEST